MSGGVRVLQPEQDDIEKMLACSVHLGTKQCTADMSRYVHARRKDGVHILNLARAWEKLILAARVIVAIENPADVVVLSARLYGQRAALKFAAATGAQCLAGRFTPGTFTNQVHKDREKFVQPRLVIVTDPRLDHQPVRESSYVNVPVIALADTDAPLKHVDIAIPCNNRSKKAIALMYWMLAREVLRMRGTIPRSEPWEQKPDLFLYRDPEEVKKEADAAATAFIADAAAPPADAAVAGWGEEAGAAAGWEATEAA